MIVYGYCKGYILTSDATLKVKVRIPSVHGPYKQSEYGGRIIHNYVRDSELPYYDSVELPRKPNEGDVVMLQTANEKTTDFTVIGLTGGSYKEGKRI